MNGVANHASLSPMPTNGKPTPTQSSSASQHSGQQNFQAHEISRGLSSTSDIPYPGLFPTTRGSSREPLFDESHAVFNSGDSNGDRRFPTTHAMRTAAHADPGLDGLNPNGGLSDKHLRSWRGTSGVIICLLGDQ